MKISQILTLLVWVSLLWISAVAQAATTGNPRLDELQALDRLVASSTARADKAAQVDALIQRGRVLQEMGALPRAVGDFRTSAEVAVDAGYQRKALLANIFLTHALLSQKADAQLLVKLEELQARAEALDWQPVSALVLNLLAGHYAADGRVADAVLTYSRALEKADAQDDALLQAQVRVNMARLAGPTQQDDATALLNDAWSLVGRLTDPADRAALSLPLGYQAMRLARTHKAAQVDLHGLAFQALDTARKDFAGLADNRGSAQALGYLGQLYEQAGKTTQAFDLTGRALLKAQSVGARDQLMQWEWQLGRLEFSQGHTEAALRAFRRAVTHIEAIRQDIPIRYKDGRSSFRETLEPVYLGLADLLLLRAIELEEDQARQQALLQEARATVELVKQTELEDYFASRCSFGTSEVALDKVSRDVAALYPILLEDRLALLVSLSDSILLRSVPVPAAQVEAEARHLSSLLRNPDSGGDYLASAGRLYDWLIRPVEDLLAQHKVGTLIYLPDRALRLVPPAALYDGEQFLVQRYRTVISPGLRMLDPHPLPRGEIRALLAGLSDPGDVVLKLPRPMLGKLARAASRYKVEAGSAGQRSVAGVLARSVSAGGDVDDEELDRLLQDPEIVEIIREFLRIPGVAAEVASLQKILPSQVILDQGFDRQTFDDQMLGESSFHVVHVASHGVFGGSAEESFVMAHDNILDMNHLEELLGADKFNENPIELLTLSACQTAEGDDRSPLGISGLAVKAQVRSALGSLWPVSDEATAALMQGFYSRLQKPELTKAEALRQAQEAILNAEGFEHPFFWSPFILIGNWL